MNYFTPERFLGLQSLDNEQRSRAATSAWEEAAEAYGAHLREITPQLPAGVRRLIELGSLHDARVLGVWQAHTRLTVVLQQEGETSRLCVLTYHLVGSPYLDPSALPERYRSRQASWLYDEIGVDRGTLFDVAAGIEYRSSTQAPANGEQQGRAAVFTHDVLLSNGWELRLRFHQLHIARPTALIPVRRGGEGALTGKPALADESRP